MKKLITLICAFVIGAMSFAQKNEIKAIEKALKNNDYQTAKSSVMAAEVLLANMDDKTKDKFYYLKAQSLNAGGAIVADDIDEAMKAIDNLMTLKEQTGKSKYLDEALAIKNQIFGSVASKAESAFKAKKYDAAAENYYKAYTMSKKDTLFLYAAATAYLNGQKFDKSLPLYEKLLELNYEGSGTVYKATNKATNELETFGNKNLRDLAVKSGKYVAPKDEKLPSKKGDVLRYMSLIYSYQGNTEKALSLISDAKKYNPNDMQLIIAEAKAYLANGQKDKMLSLLEEAKSLAGNDPVSLYNLGFYAMESGENEMAMEYFEKAIEKDPKFADAYLNIANLITTEEEAIVKEMNALGTSAADNARYDELRNQKTAVLMKAIPYLEKAYELKPTEDIGKFLVSVYNASFQNGKAKALKEKMEAGN
ncbi:tetratricopeptide repeat protein [Winogradskyella litorisediminis]|uniref:Tetratricopeptide repeat protein n=1 Tax=Winogradskyella litorisediminis TaxID=1156618 RepID=A0ABW3N3N8_9FLAO